MQQITSFKIYCSVDILELPWMTRQKFLNFLHLSYFLLTGTRLSKALRTVQIVLESSKKTLVFYSYIIPAAEKFYGKEKEKL